MAVLDVTKKARIYHTLYQLNSAFSAIVGCYRSLRETGVLDARSMRLHQGYVQEVQADFNQQFLMALQDIEMDDWNRFGKVRQAQEKELRDPDDVFLQATERRAELKKQRKKRQAKNKTSGRKPRHRS